MKLRYAKRSLMALSILGLTCAPSFAMDEESANKAIPVARALTAIQTSFDGLMNDVDAYAKANGKRKSEILFDQFNAEATIRNVLLVGTAVVRALAEVDLGQMKTENTKTPVSFESVLKTTIETTHVDDLPRVVELFGRGLGDVESNRIIHEASRMAGEQKENFFARLKENGFIRDVVLYKTSAQKYSGELDKRFKGANNIDDLKAAEKERNEKWSILSTAAHELNIPFAQDSVTIQDELRAASPLFRNKVTLDSAIKDLMRALNTIGFSFRVE